jgi:hypothetical protein
MESCMLASNPAKRYPVSDCAFADLLPRRRLIGQCRQRLGECDRHEIARIAADVGLSANELLRMAKPGPNAAKLRPERMAALHRDAETMGKSEPGTMRDLPRLRPNCASKKRCQRDLIHDPDDPMWRQYCPNAGPLNALQSEAANAR